MKKTIKVLTCVANALGQITPSYRVGIERWEPYLAQQNIALTYLCYTTPRFQTIKYRPRQYHQKIIAVFQNELRFRRLVAALDLSQFDVAVVIREATLIGPPWLERRLRAAHLPYVYHIDDPIFLPTQSHYTPLLSVARWPSKIAEIVQHSAHVIAVNKTIERYVRLINQHCTVVPLGMLVDTTPAKVSYELSSPPVLGWIGSFSTAQYLKEIQEPLQRIQTEYGCTIRVVGAPADFTLPGVTLDVVAWDGKQEDDVLRTFDIGLNPTSINMWAMGKGSTKTLQYLVHGIPCVASPTGSNIEIITHSVNGLLATTSNEWYSALKDLLDQHHLRQQLGHAGRATIKQSYNSRQHAMIIGDILRAVMRTNVCAE